MRELPGMVSVAATIGEREAETIKIWKISHRPICFTVGVLRDILPRLSSRARPGNATVYKFVLDIRQIAAIQNDDDTEVNGLESRIKFRDVEKS